MKKVFVTDLWFPLFDEMERRVKALGGELVFASAEDDDTLIREGSDALCVFNSAAKLRPAFIHSLKNCRTIVRTGIGIDTIDLPSANEMGIRIANVPDYCQSEVADHAITLALAVMRKIPRMNRETRAGVWKNDDFGYVPRMSESTVGLLGFGSIARDVARRFQGFGISIVAYDPYLPDSAFQAMGVKRAATLEDVYHTANIISLHMPLTDETYHLIDEKAIAEMKQDVFLVNTARGKLIDQDALCAGLASGKIAGAGLDVIEVEPVTTDNPLFQFENVIITPHAGYYSSVSMPELCEKLMDEVERTLRGDENRMIANRKALGL